MLIKVLRGLENIMQCSVFKIQESELHNQTSLGILV